MTQPQAPSSSLARAAYFSSNGTGLSIAIQLDGELNFHVGGILLKPVAMVVLLLGFVSTASALNAPVSLAAAAKSSSQINLTYSDRARYESGFTIERSLAASSGFKEIFRTGKDVTSFSNTGLAAGTLYFYRVRALRIKRGRTVYSAYTTVASAKTSSMVVPPPTEPPPTEPPPTEPPPTQPPPTQPPPPNEPPPPVLPPPPASSDFTHFVRPDGGTSAQCNGKTNAAYPGSGTNLNCAFKSISYALGMGTPSKLAAGDRLYIESGVYKIGYGQPGAELNSGRCYSSYTAECALSSVPSGVSISGNCSNRPKILGVEGVYTVLNLVNSSDVTLKCLEISDNVSCISRHNTANGLNKKPCKNDAYPRGEWAERGVYAEDSARVTFDRVNIHGLAVHGINAGRLTDWTLRDSNIDANGWAGWDGGFGATTSGNKGVIKFERTSISFNGCLEKSGGGYEGCWAQLSGGYGDGIGTEATGGTWIFDKVLVQGNSSDGIDMLYVQLPGGNVIVRNSFIAHNAGNQIKTSQATLIENNVIIGDCSYHKIFGGTMAGGEICRAHGNAISLSAQGNEVAIVRNNTIAGEGDSLVLGSADSGGIIEISGNIMDARLHYSGSGAYARLNYNMTSSTTVRLGTNVTYNVKEGCLAGQICQNPQFLNPAFLNFDPHLSGGSPAIGYGPNLSYIPLP